MFTFIILNLLNRNKNELIQYFIFKINTFRLKLNIYTAIKTLPAESNVTQFLLKNKNSTFNVSNCEQSGDGKQTESDINSLRTITKRIPIIVSNVSSFIPEPHVIKKCSMYNSFCINVDNYPR